MRGKEIWVSARDVYTLSVRFGVLGEVVLAWIEWDQI